MAVISARCLAVLTLKASPRSTKLGAADEKRLPSPAGSILSQRSAAMRAVLAFAEEFRCR